MTILCKITTFGRMTDTEKKLADTLSAKFWPFGQNKRADIRPRPKFVLTVVENRSLVLCSIFDTLIAYIKSTEVSSSHRSTQRKLSFFREELQIFCDLHNPQHIYKATGICSAGNRTPVPTFRVKMNEVLYPSKPPLR